MHCRTINAVIKLESGLSRNVNILKLETCTLRQ